MFPFDGAVYAPRAFTMAMRRNPNVIKAPSSKPAALAELKRHCFSLLFAMAPQTGFEPATEIGNVMGVELPVFFLLFAAVQRSEPLGQPVVGQTVLRRLRPV